MEPFLIRILIAVAVIWVTEQLLTALSIPEPARKIIFLVVLVMSILFALFGTTYIHV
jgi:hypothetical protein